MDKGRGPTILISPSKILKSSGNSSSEVFLNKAPNFVSLTLSGNNSPLVSRASVIVLNLYKVKIFSFFPGLSCLKITGLPSFIFTNPAVTNSTGLNTIIPPKAHTKSNGLLTHTS